MDICIRCFVSGRVQGVFYRASCREKAIQLGLSGYARNLPDGRVEVLACGDREALDKLKSWLAQGPQMASVSNVSCETAEQLHAGGFSIN